MRDNSLDFVKGAMIILMVFGHITYLGTTKDTFCEVNHLIYTFHMPVFLFVSGWLVKLGDDFRSHIRRIMRVAIPYVLFEIIYLVLLRCFIPMGFQFSNNVPALDVIRIANYVLLNPIGAYWFLHTLIVYNSVILIARSISNSLNTEFRFICICLLLVVAHFKLIGVNSIIFISAGVVYRAYGVKLMYGLKYSIIVFLICIFSIDGVKNNTLLHFAWALSIFGILYEIGTYKTIVAAFVQYLGRNTLAILVFHAFTVNLGRILFKDIMLLDRSGVSYAFVILSFSIGLAMALAKLFDALNISRFVFRSNTIYSGFILKPGSLRYLYHA